jgi:hypothetical protein
MQEAKTSGDTAEAEAKERFRERFRAAVNDPTALSERA